MLEPGAGQSNVDRTCVRHLLSRLRNRRAAPTRQRSGRCSDRAEPSPVTPGDHIAVVTASGVLIAESIAKERPLQGLNLHLRKVSRADAGDVKAGQPLTWTFIEFEVDDDLVADLADALSRSLETAGGWYCDFRTVEETFVVYAGRIFRYPRGNTEGRAEAEAYGRSVGVPEAQLDWPA
jgi:hypothetical protein